MWKNISRLIDGVLAVAVLAAAVYCGYWAVNLYKLPDPAEISANIEMTRERIEEYGDSIAAAEQQVAQAEAESAALLSAAEAYLAETQKSHTDLAAAAEELRAQAKLLTEGADKQEQMKADIAQIRSQYAKRVRNLEDMILAGESDYKICYLTFDDGPSYLTPEFLKELDRLEVKATFFTIGVQLQKYDYDLRDELLRKEALAGHNIANHTYTHALDGGLYKSVDSFIEAVQKQDQLVYEVTGLRTNLVRFPAGSHYTPHRQGSIDALTELGYGWIDWIGNAYDSGSTAYDYKDVMYNVIYQAQHDDITVILMHDWRTETLLALNGIVTKLREENYLFLPLFKESSTVGVAKPKWG